MKTKSNILIACTIIAVGLASFISGRLSLADREAVVQQKPVEEGRAAEVGVINPVGGTASSEGTTTASSTGENLFVASKNGQKYFPVACGSAKTIKKENAIYFKTMEEAEQSGRTKSVQCKY